MRRGALTAAASYEERVNDLNVFAGTRVSMHHNSQHKGSRLRLTETIDDIAAQELSIHLDAETRLRWQLQSPTTVVERGGNEGVVAG